MTTPKRPRNHVHLALMRRKPAAGAHGKNHKQQRRLARVQFKRTLGEEGGDAGRTGAVRPASPLR